MSEATIWIKDEVNATIVGLNDRTKNKCWNEFGFYVQGYMHRPHYKLGTWDGKKRFFSKLGNTYVQLMEQIVPLLIQEGYSLKIRDDRIPVNFDGPQTDGNPFPNYLHPISGEPLLLRPYQIEAVNAVCVDHGGIMLAGTGSGKTAMSGTIAKLYEVYGLKTIIIVPTTTLVKQSSDDLKAWGLDCGRYDGKTKELDKTHLVSTWQSLKNAPTIMEQYDVVIVDECQAAQATVLATLLEKHGRHIQFRFGLTGTMPKDPVDNMQVVLMLGSIKYEIPAHELIEAGYLSTVDIKMLQLIEPLSDKYFPDYSSESSYLRTNDKRTEWIIDHVRTLSIQEKGNTLMLVSSKAHGKKLAKLIPEAHFVSGDDETDARAIVYKLFNDNDNIIVIVTVQVGGTGLSIDRVFNLVLLDIGKSFIRVIQAIGRGLRKNSKMGKDHCYVYDLHSSLAYSKLHAKQRIKFYKEHKYPYSIELLKYKTEV